MDCTELNFENLVSLTAYPQDAVAFDAPFQVVSKYVREAEVSASQEKAIELNFDRRTFKATESMQRGANGVYCQDTFTWQIRRPESVEIDKIKTITGKPHHLKFTFLGGKVMWLRAAEDGWDGGYQHDSESCRVELKTETVCGLQMLVS